MLYVMKTRRKENKGTVLLAVVFAVALLSVLTMGMLQINTEELQLMRNQLYAAHALATAQAGLNDALSQIRLDDQWVGPYAGEPFNGGSYDVTVSGTLPNLTILSQGTSAQGFVAKVQADVTVDNASPYIIRIDNLRINE